MSTRADLQAKLTELETASAKNNTDVKTAFADLTAKITAGDTADYQPEIDQINALLGVEADTNAAAQAVIAPA